MRNQDGRYGSRATQRDLAECYGSDVVNRLSYLDEVADERWGFYQDNVCEQATIAANHGRRALRQRSK